MDQIAQHYRMEFADRSGQTADELAIDRETAGPWVQTMNRAISDAAPADAEIGRAMGEALERMALGMARG